MCQYSDYFFEKNILHFARAITNASAKSFVNIDAANIGLKNNTRVYYVQTHTQHRVHGCVIIIDLIIS